MNLKLITTAACGVFVLGACGSRSTPSSSAGTASASGVASAITTVRSGVASANIASYSPATSIVIRPSRPQDVAPLGDVGILSISSMTQSDWSTPTQAFNINNLYCGSNNNCTTSAAPYSFSSAQKWVHDMLNPSFVDNGGASVGLMGRFYNAVGQACVIGQHLSGSGLPAAGVQTITATTASVAAANAVCGTSLTIPSSSMTITVTITDVSASGVGAFDRKLEMVSASAGLDQLLFLKNDGTNYRIMTTESNTTQGYPYINRYYAAYNSSTKIAQFEGLERGFPTASSSSAGYYFYRIWTNGSTKDVRILGQNGGVGYGASGNYTTQSTMMGGSGNYGVNDASIEILTHNSGSTGSTPGTVAFEEVGCVNMSSGVIDSGVPAGACASYPLNLTALGADTLINTTVFDLPQSSWKLDETVGVIGFDNTTIFSAAATN